MFYFIYYYLDFKTVLIRAVIILLQGIDNSARKTALVQDTNYMVEKTYYIAPYVGAFGA